MSTSYTFRNLKSSINSQTHHTKNNWPNFDNTIEMRNEDRKEEDMKEFTRLVEKSENT